MAKRQKKTETKAAEPAKAQRRRQPSLPAKGMVAEEIPELTDIILRSIEMGSEMGSLRQELGSVNNEAHLMVWRLIADGRLAFNRPAYENGEKVEVYSFTDDSGEKVAYELSKKEVFAIKSKRKKMTAADGGDALQGEA